ncbi:uncharacterized protein LOC130087282 [Rhinichthys klamathensis goyatoka]|uniref:uncharacterized protein LOC130087282 n=1 Tax=Rhinichthys klamathensis goyatoka TaxID=3034132 RepID=UPI0024B50E0E|nr:uncharacterized protein LOC130087282 [Rhinichthys klamathensis goyatoka]
MLQRRVSQDSPTTSRDLRYSGRISSTPGALPPRSFLTTSVTSARVMDESTSEPCQQPPTSTVNSVGRALFPSPEALDSWPESLRGQPIVLLHGLTELLPGPNFCLHNHPGCSPLGLPVPVSCLRSPTSQPGPIGLLLQLDGILYFRCPPPGSGIAASTGTGDLTATAPSSRFDNGGGEHGPLRLNISSLPRDPVVAPPEVGVEDLSDRRLGQTFPANPYSTLGSAESVQPPPPPSDPTHHQVVIS